MGLVDGTRELMRHDLEVWPSEAGDGWSPEAGITRRGFLVGAGFAAAVVAAGGIAWRVAPWRDWLGAAGDKLGVDLPGASGAVHDYALRLPLRRQARRLQHRLAARRAAGRSAARVFRAPGTQRRSADGVRGLRGDGGPRDESPPYAVVGVRGGETYWHPRKSGEDYLGMLLHELIPTCARRFKLGGGGRKRAVIGWSMGAYGALVAAETEPDLFAAVVAVSPAVWTSYDAMMLGPRDAFDDAADFAKYDVIAHADRLARVHLRIDCGKQDPFYCYVTSLTAALPKPAAGGFSKGGHDHEYASKVAPAEARFIGRALG